MKRQKKKKKLRQMPFHKIIGVKMFWGQSSSLNIIYVGDTYKTNFYRKSEDCTVGGNLSNDKSFFAKFEQYGNLGSAECTVIGTKLLPHHNVEELERYT